MFCTRCGANNPDGAFCCTSCGSPLNKPQAPQQPMYQAPQQPVYQQPVYPAQPVYNVPVKPAVPAKGLSIASMVLGIVSLALFCLWYLALPCAIVGVVLGALAMNKSKFAGVKNNMAIAGVACSCVALGVAIIFIIIAVASCNSLMYY